jgi:hypothetical protein
MTNFKHNKASREQAEHSQQCVNEPSYAHFNCLPARFLEPNNEFEL